MARCQARGRKRADFPGEEVTPVQNVRERNRFVAAVVGTVLVALCCFTPVLAIALGALGLAAWTGYLDWILWPLLVVLIYVGVRAYGEWRRAEARRRAGQA